MEFVKKQINKFRQLDFGKKMRAFFFAVMLILIALFCVQEIYYIIIAGFAKGAMMPPLFHKDFNDSFMDFFNINYYVSNNDPYGVVDKTILPSNYPPLALAISKIFQLFTDYGNGPYAARASAGGIISLLLFFAIVFVAIFFLLRKFCKTNNMSKKVFALLLIIFCFSMPVLFSVQRGNYLLLAFIFVCFYLLYKDDPRKIYRELALIALASAIAIKLYPAVFGIFLLKEKRFKDILRLGAYSAFLLIAPFLLFVGGLAGVERLLEAMKSVTANYILIRDGIAYNYGLSNNYSIFNVAQLVQMLFNGGNTLDIAASHAVAKIFTPILFVMLLVMLLVLKKKWQVSAVCVLMMTFLPNPSYTYVLIFFMIPLAQLLVEEKKEKKDYIALVVLIIILNPFHVGYVLDYGSFFLGFSINMLLINIANVVLTGLLLYSTVCAIIQMKNKRIKEIGSFSI